MGWGSEVRGERVLEMSVAGLHFQLIHGFPKACGDMAEEDPELFQILTENGIPPSHGIFKGQVQK